jgi:hypothetical protein
MPEVHPDLFTIGECLQAGGWIVAVQTEVEREMVGFRR